MPWFSTKGQILQTVLTFLALVLATYKAFPDMMVNNYFSAGAIIFYLLVGLVLVSFWFVFRPLIATREKIRQLPPSGRVSWIAGLLYGFGVALGLYILFAAVGRPWQRRDQSLVPSKEERSVSVPPVPPLPPVLNPNTARKEFIELDFWGQRDRLLFDFLNLPRPCLVKVTAPPEHVALRSLLTNALYSSYVLHLGNSKQVLIGRCEIRADERDNRPDKFPDQMDYGPEGIVTVSGAPAQREAVEFLAREFTRLFEWKRVRRGEDLPPGSPDNLIHIQIGPGALR